LPEGIEPRTRADEGQILVIPCKPINDIPEAEQSQCRTGVDKLLHMMRWSRPEILNSVRELSRHMKVAAPVHLKAIFRVLKYCTTMPEQGLLLKPTRQWDGNPNFEFEVGGLSDANYATDPSTRRSVSGYSVLLEEALISMKSGRQKSVTLMTAES
jgi:hypothetical protein